MLQILWEYRVHREKAQEFEKYYGPRGDWAEFFRQGAGYLGTMLLRDPDHVDHYVTVDQWDSADDYVAFREKYAAGYKQHDDHCNQFTIDERLVGYFETLT
jgi:heme-degrading monooxygenase HmoA